MWKVRRRGPVHSENTSARCRVEHVDVSGVGGDVESFALAGRLAALHSDDDVVWRALDAAGAVDEGVGAEFLDDGDGDG